MTSDAHSGVKIREIVRIFKMNNLKNQFNDKDYGIDIKLIAFFLICRDSKLNLKQRIRFDKKEKTLDIDIMLNLDLFRKIQSREKFEIVRDKLKIDTQKAIDKFCFKSFNEKQFMKDFTIWIDGINTL